MEATNWIKPTNQTTNNKPSDDYDKVFELLKFRSDSMKNRFRKLGVAIVENDQEAVNEIINYFKKNSSSELTTEQVDGLKFMAETAERGPEAMAYRQLYEMYYPKADFSHIEKIPADIFYWKDSQGIDQNQKSKYKKPTNNQRDKGHFGGLI
jgi:hypothetical protein